MIERGAGTMTTMRTRPARRAGAAVAVPEPRRDDGLVGSLAGLRPADEVPLHLQLRNVLDRGGGRVRPCPRRADLVGEPVDAALQREPARRPAGAQPARPRGPAVRAQGRRLLRQPPPDGGGPPLGRGRDRDRDRGRPVRDRAYRGRDRADRRRRGGRPGAEPAPAPGAPGAHDRTGRGRAGRAAVGRVPGRDVEGAQPPRGGRRGVLPALARTATGRGTRTCGSR